MTDIKVGDKLWYVPIYKREPALEVTVTKVGRKWIEIDHSWLARLDKHTLAADGGKGVSPGQAYLTKADWELEQAVYDAWGKMRTTIDKMWRPPKHLTLGDIQAMAAKIAGKAALEGENG